MSDDQDLFSSYLNNGTHKQTNKRIKRHSSKIEDFASILKDSNAIEKDASFLILNKPSKATDVCLNLLQNTNTSSEGEIIVVAIENENLQTTRNENLQTTRNENLQTTRNENLQTTRNENLQTTRNDMSKQNIKKEETFGRLEAEESTLGDGGATVDCQVVNGLECYPVDVCQSELIISSKSLDNINIDTIPVACEDKLQKTLPLNETNNCIQEKSQPKVIETNNCIQEKSQPKVIETNNCIQEKSQPKVIETNNCIQEKSQPKVIETNNCIQEKSQPKVIETNNCIQEKSQPRVIEINNCIQERSQPKVINNRESPVSTQLKKIDFLIKKNSDQKIIKTLEQKLNQKIYTEKTYKNQITELEKQIKELEKQLDVLKEENQMFKLLSKENKQNLSSLSAETMSLKDNKEIIEALENGREQMEFIRSTYEIEKQNFCLDINDLKSEVLRLSRDNSFLKSVVRELSSKIENDKHNIF